jgi:hypothetical protein
MHASDEELGQYIARRRKSWSARESEVPAPVSDVRQRCVLPKRKTALTFILT